MASEELVDVISLDSNSGEEHDGLDPGAVELEIFGMKMKIEYEGST
jgi:hypothetical protein